MTENGLFAKQFLSAARATAVGLLGLRGPIAVSGVYKSFEGLQLSGKVPGLYSGVQGFGIQVVGCLGPQFFLQGCPAVGIGLDAGRSVGLAGFTVVSGG